MMKVLLASLSNKLKSNFLIVSFINVAGVLDEKTLEWMNKPRCGVPDREFKTSATNSFETRRKRFSVEGISSITSSQHSFV